MDTGNNPAIHYPFLTEALAFYTARGFEYKEVPWMVSGDVIRTTLPAGATPFSVSNDHFLVGSAEQSFVQLMMLGKSLGKHCAITPCFRDDPVDALHQKYFMKLELYRFLPSTATEAQRQHLLHEMIGDALAFYRQHLPVRTEKTDIGIDIVANENGVELGSYGIRSLKDSGGDWVYGTGVAEPRLSSVLASLKVRSRR